MSKPSKPPAVASWYSGRLALDYAEARRQVDEDPALQEICEKAAKEEADGGPTWFHRNYYAIHVEMKMPGIGQGVRAMADTTQEWIDREIRRLVQEMNDRIEADLIRVLGWRTRLPKPVISRLGYEVIYQRPEGSVLENYRGIMRHGRWLVDHHPDWPGGRSK